MADSQVAASAVDANSSKSNEKSGTENKDDSEAKHVVLVKFEEIISLPQSQWIKELNTFNNEYKWQGEKLHLKHWTKVFEKLKEPFVEFNKCTKMENEKKDIINNNEKSLIENNNKYDTNLLIALLNCFIKLLSHTHRPGIATFKILDVCFICILCYDLNNMIVLFYFVFVFVFFCKCYF